MPRLIELLESDPRFDDAVGRQAGLGHAEMQRHVGPGGGEAPIHFDHLRRVGILERHAIAREPKPVQQLAMLQRAGQHRAERIVGRESPFRRRIDAAAIHAHADGAVVLGGHVGQIAHLVLPRLFALVVIEMARVVADLVDVRRDHFRQPIVFLQIDREIGRRLLAHGGQRFGVAAAIDGDAHDVGPGADKIVHLGDRGGDVLRGRGRHALHRHRMAGADRDASRCGPRESDCEGVP